MRTRFHPDRNASQIVFDTAGDEPQFKTMSLETIPNKPPRQITGKDSFAHPPADNPTSFPSPDPDSSSEDDPSLPHPPHPPSPHPRRRSSFPDSALSRPFEPPKSIPLAPFAREYAAGGGGVEPPPASPHPSGRPRDIMKVDDIDGTRPTRRARSILKENDPLDVKDINNDGIFKSTRVVDPLNPVYFYDGRELRDDFGKSRKPKAGHQSPDRTFSLDDIEGAHAGSMIKLSRTKKHAAVAGPSNDGLKMPSMQNESRRLEMEQAMRNLRNEKVRAYESRCGAEAAKKTRDPVGARHVTF